MPDGIPERYFRIHANYHNMLGDCLLISESFSVTDRLRYMTRTKTNNDKKASRHKHLHKKTPLRIIQLKKKKNNVS